MSDANQEKEDEVLRRMLATKPTPHKPADKKIRWRESQVKRLLTLVLVLHLLTLLTLMALAYVLFGIADSLEFIVFSAQSTAT